MTYHLFAGDWYYPSSMLGDYVDAYNTVEEAKAYVTQHEFIDWACIVVVDRRTSRLTVVEKYNGSEWEKAE